MSALPLTKDQLKQHVQQSCERGASILRHEWIPSCVKIISDRRDDVEDVMSEIEVHTVASVTIWGKYLQRYHTPKFGE